MRTTNPPQPAASEPEPSPGNAPTVKPHLEDEADVRAAIDDAAAGRVTRITPEEIEHWAETGEWPESLT